MLVKTLFVLVLILFSTNLHASHARGVIKTLIVGKAGHQVYVQLAGAPQTCGSDHPLGFNYGLSLSSHGAAKEILSVLLAAQLAGREVTIQGAGVCSFEGSMEDISYVYLH